MKIALIVALLAPLFAHAQVFKCNNDKGAIEYSDRPCGASAEPMRIQVAPKDVRMPGDDPNARALRILESDKRRKEPPPECRFSYYVQGDKKGQSLARNAKEECLKNADLRAAGRSDEVSTEQYKVWKDHRDIESADRRAVMSSQRPMNCTRNGVNGMICR